MSDHIWETFDDLFKTVYRQGRTIEGLEARLSQLERRLHERAGAAQPEGLEQRTDERVTIERAA